MWFLLPIASSFLNASINLIDKYVIEKYIKGRNIGSLVLFSSILGFPLCTLIYIFKPDVINVSSGQALVLVLSGIFLVLWTIPYFYSLDIADTGTVAPLFQISSVFSILLAFIVLKEVPTLTQITGILTIIIGSLALVYDLDIKEVNFKLLALMALSGLIIAFNSVLFKLIAIETDFWTASFWSYIGFSLVFIYIVFFISRYRKDFIFVLKNYSQSVLSLNMVNEILAVVSQLIFSYAIYIAPIGLVTFMAESTQPVFVLVLTVLITKYVTKQLNEDISKVTLIKKTAGILVVLAGSYLLLI